jgi:hypothetical protein
MKRPSTFIPSFNNQRNFLAVFFFAALFFLCGADQTFTFRIMGFNVRWGQFLLLGFALLSLWKERPEALFDSPKLKFYRQLLKYWVFFFFFSKTKRTVRFVFRPPRY